jgi:curved DNA-binding protein
MRIRAGGRYPESRSQQGDADVCDVRITSVHPPLEILNRSGNGQRGDLYLEIEFAPHPTWRVDGRDLYVTLRVAPWEAALGAAVNVATPSGTVEMNVPADSQTGRKLRLRGRGIPGSPPGDFYVILEVVLPPASDDKARAVYRQLAKDLAFDPRAAMGANA